MMKGMEKVKLIWTHRLRWFAIFLQLTLIPFAIRYEYLAKKDMPLYLLIVFCLALLNIRKLWRGLALYQSIAFQCIVDITGFIAFILICGRLENPFWPLIYLHAAMGAILIPPKKDYQYLPFLVGGMALTQALSIRHYSSIAFVLIPQWIILLAIWFLTRNIGLLISRQQREIHKLNQKELKGQKLSAIGLLSSGILHEIGTPLNTVRLKVNRMLKGSLTEQDLFVLEKSLTSAEEVIAKLNQAQMESEENIIQKVELAQFIKESLEHWRQDFPELMIQFEHQAPKDLVKMASANFSLVLGTLLKNSYEAGADKVLIKTDEEADAVALRINDNGPGFAPFVLENFMAPYTSTKGKGRGIGLFNANLNLEAMGAEMTIANNSSGAIVSIKLEKSHA